MPRFATFAAVAACLFAAVPSDGGLHLAKDGQSAYVIMVPDQATEAEKLIANDLKDYLKKITGAWIPVILESDLAGGEAPQILVGRTEAAKKLDLNALARDGIVIKTAGQNLILAGGGPRGTIYAVNTFLEDTLGVRWWTSDEETVPQKPTLDIPDLNITYVPKLSYRETYNEDAINDHALFATRLKVNGHMSKIPESLGGHYTLIGWCHTSFDLIPPGKYFGDHPEWFAQISGKRQGGTQLCLTNPDMKKELIRRALNKVRKNPEAGIISITQNDCGGPCQCDRCQAVVKEEGSEAGPWIRLCNEAAEEINKQYPGFLVETLAYQYTRHPNKVTHPSKNVIVRLCSIEADFAHPLSGESNKGFGDDLRGWSAISPNLFIWNYVTSFTNYLMPHPNMTSLGEDLRFFVDNHVIGVFEQGDAYNIRTGDMLPLRAWLLAHLMWDPSRDQTKLRDEFCNGYFGAAGPMMIQYLDLVNAPAKNPALRIGCYNGDTSFLTDEALEKASALFDSAAKSVAGDSVLAQRVGHERIVLDHVKLMRFDFAAALKAHPGDRQAVRDEYRAAAHQWISAVRATGVKNFSEGQGFDSYVSPLLSRADQLIPVKLPAAGAALPDGQFDIQEDQFKLFRPGERSALVDDPKASNGRAARIPGDGSDWSIQFHVPKNAKFNGPGPWDCYVVVRAETKNKGGIAFQYGLYEGPTGNYLAVDRPAANLAADGDYHTYCISVEKLSPDTYFWIAPPGTNDKDYVYVDRIFIQKQDKR